MSEARGVSLGMIGLIVALIVQASAFTYAYAVFTTKTEYRLQALEDESKKMRDSIDKLTFQVVPKR